MKGSKWIAAFSVALGFWCIASPFARADIGYQFVPIGNAGNANDPATGNVYGSVDYAFQIGKFDVTLTQYTAFLNAVAQTDPYNLYNSKMATDLNIAGISQTLVGGSYVYAVIGDGQRPVTWVSWFDAARFANWMQNGQPAGLGETDASTEDGAYSLHGAVTGMFFKNANAQYWIPSESEWYKAAYYDPSLNGGAGGYWTYPTRSNVAPGNVVGSGANQANSWNSDTGIYSVTQSTQYLEVINYLTDVGAFTNSASAYGTYDQGGDVWNWNDGVINSAFLSITNGRGLRGGCWGFDVTYLASSGMNGGQPTDENAFVGFRLATVSESAVALSIGLVPGHPEEKALSFQPIVTGRTYTVEYTDTLAPASWQALTAFSQSDNGVVRTVIDNAAPSDHRFYRIVIDEP